MGGNVVRYANAKGKFRLAKVRDFPLRQEQGFEAGVLIG